MLLWYGLRRIEWNEEIVHCFTHSILRTGVMTMTMTYIYNKAIYVDDALNQFDILLSLQYILPINIAIAIAVVIIRPSHSISDFITYLINSVYTFSKNICNAFKWNDLVAPILNGYCNCFYKILNNIWNGFIVIWCVTWFNNNVLKIKSKFTIKYTDLRSPQKNGKIKMNEIGENNATNFDHIFMMMIMRWSCWFAVVFRFHVYVRFWFVYADF